MPDAGQPAAADDDLERRFRTRLTRVGIGGRELTMLHPANADELISESDFARDERLPYWADLWPSAHALASWIAAHGAGDGPRRTMLELGCGAGLVSVAARLAGLEVLATDYYEDALRFARANARRNGLGELATRLVDWRAFPEDLGRFDLVVASDVLYERPYASLVADAFLRTIAPGGTGVMADPGRVAAGAFLQACAERGLDVRLAERVPYEDGTIRQTIDLYELRLR
jgi:predicted nicotinamide N-methyase